MAFQGGPIGVLGITPAYVSGLATQTASSGVSQTIGQIWQGAGQSFIGQAGQALAGDLAGSAINVAMDSLLTNNVVGSQGKALTSGNNLLATTITPFVTNTVAQTINQTISQSLTSAGPFGPLLSDAATGITTQIFSGLSSTVVGATASGPNYKMFPGGGDEPPSDYGGSAYTLTDVVFSLQPANQGPQAFGDATYTDVPMSATTVPFDSWTSSAFSAPNATADFFKQAEMGVDITGLSRNIA